MVLKTNSLYLIKVASRTVAIIPGKDPLEAINKYLTRIGFANIRAYFCSRLMTNIITIDTNSTHSKDYFVVTCTKITSGSYLSIDSYEITYCDDIFSLVYFKDISDPLFIRPTIEEVRKCVGFRNAPEYELRKFCI